MIARILVFRRTILLAAVLGLGAAGAPQAGAAAVVPAEVAQRLDVKTAKAATRALERDLDIVGSVRFDGDRVAIVGPKLDGRVVSLRAKAGQSVNAGDVLAEIESVELARAAAEYLGLRARARAAEMNAKRERDLAEKNVSSARERELAESEAAAISAQEDAAAQLLLALGLSREELPKTGGSRPLSRYVIRAPIAGTVVERNAEPGEAVEAGRSLFKVADLSRVWVVLEVFERDLAWVQPGLAVEITSPAQPGRRWEATVALVRPEIAAATRTAEVYVEVPNADLQMVPGRFVNARLKSSSQSGAPNVAVVTVPRDAVQFVDGQTMVFVRRPDGSFEPRTVALGSTGVREVEIRDGVRSGEDVAVQNAFLLKSEVLR
jgi:cobalt-zinc-cadmium efflux system membrane fusion protein